MLELYSKVTKKAGFSINHATGQHLKLTQSILIDYIVADQPCQVLSLTFYNCLAITCQNKMQEVLLVKAVTRTGSIQL
jgi:hypothetical protein